MSDKTLPCKIRLMNEKGDEIISSFDLEKPETIEIAQNDLTAFLNDCVTRFGKKPAVWSRRIGTTEFEPFEGDMAKVDEIVAQYPLIGG